MVYFVTFSFRNVFRKFGGYIGKHHHEQRPPTETLNPKQTLFSVLFDSMSCVGLQGFCWLC